MIEITSDVSPIILNPTREEEIIQNIKTILGTVQGSVPLDRGFGIDIATIDEPIPIAKARLTGTVLTAIQTYEPRVEVLQVLFEEDHSIGQLKPIVQINIREEGDG
ncbi:GPW/gp25 family protein [Paenibacillus harenae]|uniref:Phage baseplate assembly protein W n=1 Tax=Paenibacillus harenae TaxID=306543 RepID=A0ABT9U3Y5_PAEHA|nr:GPW/gp25 family protein [Paenibacillus harenae]MDQ0114350.1 phage baseplate assembly protein W [Paenibacillus harenae]